MSIRVVVADDHNLMREALCNKLDSKPDLEVIAQADNGLTAVDLCRKHIPDIILMDVSMPDLNGVEAARRVHDDDPNIKIIALSMHSDQKFVLDMLKAGASAYLLKACRFGELLHAIKVVVSGEIYLDQSISTQLIRNYLGCISQKKDSGFEILTGREREVLQMVVEGKSSKEIAFRLGIEKHTIVKHRQNVMKKLDIHDIPGLTKYALRKGITSL